jgi:phosphoglucomutase/phosphomannomutase
MSRDQTLSLVAKAVEDDRLTKSAAENIRTWLTEPRYADFAEEVERHVQKGMWKELDDVFWTVIPFGTGGRRGRMYPIGTNAINDRTIGESAQGLAEYVREASVGQVSNLSGDPQELSCAIAYDTRHRSPHFARLCAEIMAAAGFRVFFLEGFRSTPELSYAVRYKRCSCGIMVTASHNPPSDNAVKVYWSTGGQILPPHDKRIIERVMNVDRIERVPWDEAVSAGQIVCCAEEVDAAFIDAVAQLSSAVPRDLGIVYSPLHGVGASAVVPVLHKCGFGQVQLYTPHAEPDGDFPNVPQHVANPENPGVFDDIAAYAASSGADLVVASDPDCDRIGCSAPLVASRDAPWRTLTGNQIGALLADYVLETRQRAGRLSPEHFVVETLVTTALVRRIAETYGVRVIDNLLVGFKWIAGAIDENGPDRFVFGTEESHGYLAGTHVRDKDGAAAALLLCELAATLKAAGKTLHEKLDDLMWQHGAHVERTVSIAMPGSEGMAAMKEVMARLREVPPKKLAGADVVCVRDFASLTATSADGGRQSLTGTKGDLVMLDLALAGNYVAVRPSGTEPKIKLYMFAFEPAEQLANLEDAKEMLAERLDAIEQDLRSFAGV